MFQDLALHGEADPATNTAAGEEVARAARREIQDRDIALWRAEEAAEQAAVRLHEAVRAARRAEGDESSDDAATRSS